MSCLGMSLSTVYNSNVSTGSQIPFHKMRSNHSVPLTINQITDHIFANSHHNNHESSQVSVMKGLDVIL